MKVLKKLYKSKPVKFIRHLLLINVLICFLVVVVLLPYRISMFLGRILGFFVCYTAGSYRKKTDENLRIALPDCSLSEIIRIRNEVYSNIGMNFVEFTLLSFRPRSFWLKRIKIIGREKLDKYINAGQGIIMLSAHVGNWELFGAYLSMIGYPITVVAREVYDERLNWLLVNMRLRNGVRTISRSGRSNTKRMISTIKKGEILGVLIDQDTSVGGMFVDFFGRPAYTPTAISQFARIKNSVVVPCFILRRKALRHEIIVMEPQAGGVDERMETQEYTKIIENVIRENISQWVWMHPRWKRKSTDAVRRIA